MRYIGLLLLLVAFSSYANENTLLDEFIDYGVKVNGMESEEGREQMACVLTLVFHELDESEIMYFKSALEHSKAYPYLKDEEVGEQASSLYDYSGEIKKVIQGKVDALENEIRKCFSAE